MIDIKGDVDRFECVYKECGARCCKPPKATVGDVKRISSKLSIPPEEFAEAGDNKGISHLKGKNGSCVFLNADYGCRLYQTDSSIVPLSCRMFPFLFDGITYSDDIILSMKIAKDCPGCGRGGLLGDELKSRIEVLGAQFVREIDQYMRARKQGKSFNEILDAFQ